MNNTSKIIKSLQAFGTERTLLNITETLGEDEERRFWRAFNAFTVRVLENTKIKVMADQESFNRETGGNILRRGRIADLIERSLKYAVRKTPEYACSKCHGECGVVNLTTDAVFLKCRKCGHEFRKEL